MALALYDPTLPQLQCAVCDVRPSADAPWAAFRVTYAPDRITEVSRTPCGDFCLDCKESVSEALAPQKPDLPAIAAECKTSPQQKSKYRSYRARRDGKRTNMQRGSVHTVTRVGCRWEETALPVRKQDLQDKAGSADVNDLPVAFVKVKDANMVQQEVVLAQTPEPPKVVMFTEVVAEFQEHACIGPQQLRSAQAQEFWRQLLAETMHSRPTGATVTSEQLDRMVAGLGGRPHAPAQPGAPQAAEEDGTTVVTVVEDGDAETILHRPGPPLLAPPRPAPSCTAHPAPILNSAPPRPSLATSSGGTFPGSIAAVGGSSGGGQSCRGSADAARDGLATAAMLEDEPSGRGRGGKGGRGGRGGRGRGIHVF